MRAAIVAAGLLWSATVGAEPLTLTAPEECGSVDELRLAVERDAGFAWTEDLAVTAVVTIERDDVTSEYRASLQIATGEGSSERQVSARECPAVLDAASFVIAQTMQEVRADAEPSPPAPAAPAPVIHMEEPRERRPPAPPLGVRARFDVQSAVGAVPGVGLGLAGAIGVERRAASVEAGAEAYLPSRAEESGSSMAGADVRLIALRLRGCGALAAWRACGGGTAGWLHGQGVGLADARGATRRWSAVVMSLGWRRPIGSRLAITVELEGQVGVERPRFTLDDGTLLYRSAPVSARLAVGLEARIR